jgi:hypothetical protein
VGQQAAAKAEQVLIYSPARAAGTAWREGVRKWKSRASLDLIVGAVTGSHQAGVAVPGHYDAVSWSSAGGPWPWSRRSSARLAGDLPLDVHSRGASSTAVCRPLRLGRATGAGGRG